MITVINGLNQLDWLAGKQPTSNRVGYLYWMGAEIYGVRWRNFKLVLRWSSGACPMPQRNYRCHGWWT